MPGAGRTAFHHAARRRTAGGEGDGALNDQELWRRADGEAAASQLEAQAAERHAPPAAPLWSAKLVVPHPPWRMVARARLFELLDAGVQGPVTLLTAPAGAGKSVLLASWARSARLPGPVAWVSLDHADSDPTRFWAYVLAALRRSGAVPAKAILRTLAPPRPDAVAAFLPLLVDGLARLDGPVVLVLDDFHELSGPAVAYGVDFLLRVAPPQLRLVIATRADPALPLLSRLRVSGALVELRAAELAFTAGEAAELLAGHGLALPDADLALLHARTEGWAAGLRLAALALHGQPDPSRAVAALAGSDRTIADFLVAEVLDRQPAQLRDFLLRTCVADRISGALADALTGRQDGDRTLDWLERSNLFVVALGPGRAWYRYHHLFVELLRYELRRQAPGEVAGLHRRAARWHAAHGFPVEAIRHALDAEDWDQAAELLVEHGVGLGLRGQSVTIRQLYERLPGEVVRANPELAALVALDRYTLADHDGVAAYLELARRQRHLLPEGRTHRYGLLIALLQLVSAWGWGRLDEALAAGRDVLALQARAGAQVVPGAWDDDVRAVALGHLGAAELWTGDLDAAEAHLRDGWLVAEQVGFDSSRLNCMSQLAVLHVARGQLHAALRTGRAAVEFAEQRGWSTSSQVAGAHFALAWACLERDELTEAGRHVEQALASCHAYPQRPVGLGAALVQARLRQAQGDPVGGSAVLSAARQELAGWTPPSWLRRCLAVTDAELHTAAGDSAAARLALEGLEEGRDDGPSTAAEAVALARLLLADGDPAGAAEALSPALQGRPPAGSPAPLVTAWLLAAVAAQALGDHARASRSLERALALAAPEGFRQAFADGGAPARALLEAHLHEGTAYRSFVGDLLESTTEPAPQAPASAALVGLVDQLSERERVVLRYLPSRLSAAEIADELYVSVHTVKTHIRHIYRKLQATSRREAISQARRLQLI